VATWARDGAGGGALVALAFQRGQAWAGAQLRHWRRQPLGVAWLYALPLRFRALAGISCPRENISHDGDTHTWKNNFA